jgi:hypothetical protein
MAWQGLDLELLGVEGLLKLITNTTIEDRFKGIT